MEPRIRDLEGVLALLDALLAPTDGAWWDSFYADRTREIPFFVDKPDEHLAEAIEHGVVRPGRALDLGCGPGRNALHLVSRAGNSEHSSTAQIAPRGVAALARTPVRAAGGALRGTIWIRRLMPRISGAGH